MIDVILGEDKTKPPKQRHTAKRIFDRLRYFLGFSGHAQGSPKQPRLFAKCQRKHTVDIQPLWATILKAKIRGVALGQVAWSLMVRLSSGPTSFAGIR